MHSSPALGASSQASVSLHDTSHRRGQLGHNGTGPTPVRRLWAGEVENSAFGMPSLSALLKHSASPTAQKRTVTCPL